MRVWGAESAWVARDARVQLALGGVHDELNHLAVRHPGVVYAFRGCGVSRAKDEVAVAVGWRVLAVGEFGRLDIARGVGVACGVGLLGVKKREGCGDSEQQGQAWCGHDANLKGRNDRMAEIAAPCTQGILRVAPFHGFLLPNAPPSNQA